MHIETILQRRSILANQTGFLLVFVTTGNGFFPVPGAEVIISRLENGIDTVVARYVTDESGQAPVSELATPDKSSSLSSSSPGPDNAFYNVTVSGEGYYTLVSLDTPVFQGILSRQPMVLTPYTASDLSGENDYRPACPPYEGGCGSVSEKGDLNE